ncbi:MAG TPA: nitroreductase/quinone reductase family protein [Actinopolymorphaceae bacterium]|jgi:deazaflavin-dependent oxidoreductase (nitroreductase family)
MARRNDERLRHMYSDGRGNATAKRYARFWATVFRLGLPPRRWVTLEVPGRKTGTAMRVPLGMADWQDNWYLVSMLGDCNWVRNVRAAQGHATLHHRHSTPVRLAEVPVEQRAAILKRYLQTVPGGRPHIPVDRREPVESFEAIAALYPVFLVKASPDDTS